MPPLRKHASLLPPIPPRCAPGLSGMVVLRPAGGDVSALQLAAGRQQSGHARLRLNNRAVCCTCSRPVLAHRDASLRRTDWVAIEGIADMPAASRTSGCDATDPKPT